MVKYRIWQVIAFLISLAMAGLINPATFGISPFSDNIALNVATRIVILIVVYLILSNIGKPKKAK